MSDQIKKKDPALPSALIVPNPFEPGPFIDSEGD